MSESFRRRALTRLAQIQRGTAEQPGTEATEPLPATAWGFLTRCVFTNDEYAKDKGIDPVQKFPDKPELRYLTGLWESKEERRIRVEKSRDLVVTWWAAGVHLFAALVYPGIYVGYQSKKLLDANVFLESRFMFMWRRIPVQFRRPRATHNKSAGIITVERDDGPPSFIVGVPEGTDQARQWKYAYYLWDEASVTEKAEAVMTALEPALSAYGTLTMIGTAKGAAHLFKRLGYDQVSG